MNTLIFNYGYQQYQITYKTPEMAFPETIRFSLLKFALYFIADFYAATGIQIKSNI